MLKTLNLKALNSATKYPSIPTYHALGSKGRLTDAVSVDFAGQAVTLSEKIDGTNSRVIVAPDGSFLVGSRNDLLWHSGDLLHNPAQGIVDVLRPVVARLARPDKGRLRVFYGESYGGRITGQSQHYSRRGATAFRLFDVAEFDLADLAAVLRWDLSQIAAWRAAGEQPFVPASALESLAGDVPVAPRIACAEPVPTSVPGVLDWMAALLPETRCRIDDSGLGEPEGLIVRTEDRSRIAKIRYQDYRRARQRPSRGRKGGPVAAR